MGHQIALVQARFCSFHHFQIAFGGLVVPVDRVAVPIQASQVFTPGADVLFRQRRHGNPVLAKDLGGDSLHHLGLDFRVNQYPKVAVAVGIDKARCNYQPACVDHFHRIVRLDRTDFGNPVVLHQYIRFESCFLGSVDDKPALNQFFHPDAPPVLHLSLILVYGAVIAILVRF